MSDLVEKLRLKALAEEDVYFAKHDLELIRALQQKRLIKPGQCRDEDQGQGRELSPGGEGDFEHAGRDSQSNASPLREA